MKAYFGDHEIGNALDNIGAMLYQFNEENTYENENGDVAVMVPQAKMHAMLIVIAMIVNAFENDDIRIE